MDKVIARWESKSGKHWVEIRRSESGFLYYDAPGAHGSFGNITEDEAIQQIEARVEDFQPGSNKTPMIRMPL